MCYLDFLPADIQTTSLYVYSGVFEKTRFLLTFAVRMTNVINHINDLLFIHECVIIPGLGGFVTNYRPSRLDEKRGVFYPPTKEISFNRSLTKNDGLLVNWIVRNEGIGYEKANRRIALFVEDVKVKLNQGQRVVVENVGILFCDRHFNILFEPVNYNFFTDSWGMEEVLVSPFYSHAHADRSNASVGKWLKYGVAASLLGGGMFVLGEHAEELRNSDYNIPEEASIGSVEIFSHEDTKQDAPHISNDDELVDYDPLEDFEK